MAYVAMTRGKDENHAFIYQPITGEADHEHATPVAGPEIHRLRRGNKYAAAHYFRMILANDDRPRTVHAEAERAEGHLLPPLVADLLDRNEHRRADRRESWRRAAAYDRVAETHARAETSERDLSIADDGLEL